MTKINLMPKKSWKTRALKGFSIFAQVSLIFQMSSLGVFLTPSAQAAEVNVASNPIVQDSLKVTAPSEITENTAATPNIANPGLDQTCGLDIGLIIDTSGSVDSGEMSDMKAALTNFANAFTNTPTVFSLVSFNANSTPIQNFSRTPAQMANDINSPSIPSEGDRINGWTNWDSGLARSYDTFDPRPAKSNLIVIATDGSPNSYGYPPNSTIIPAHGVASPAELAAGLSHAIDRANAIKSAGTRIVVLGIGDDDSDPATPAEKLGKMEAISGANVATTAGTITVNTDVIKVTNFAGIGAALSAFAGQLCGGKILVQKHVDVDGDGQFEYDGNIANSALAGWEFDVNGSPSNPAAVTTDNTGYLSFDVNAGTYSVTETIIKDHYSLTNATCTTGAYNSNNNAVEGITIGNEGTVSCDFYNSYIPYCGDGTVNPTSEVCDDGLQNGQVCTPNYNSSCSYCSNTCQPVQIPGPNCGDGILQPQYEDCDDGNRDNTDACNNLCQSQTCNLVITKSVNKTEASTGDALTYTLNYVNNGTQTCTGTGVKIYDSLDNNLIYQSGSASIDNPTKDLDHDGISYYGVFSEDFEKPLANAHRVSPGESGTITFQALVNTPQTCGNFEIPNKGKIWCNESGYHWSNEVLTDIDMDCHATLIVEKKVINDNDGIAEASDFTMNVTGNNPTPNSFPGDENGTSVKIYSGSYSVTESGPTGYAASYSPDCAGTIANGETKTCTITNDDKPGIITGSKFNDLNGDGIKNEGEPGLPDWEICAVQYINSDTFTINGGSEENCAITNASGYYEITDLNVGRYTVFETQQKGWTQTFPNDPNTYTVDIASGAISEKIDFGNFKNVNIKAFKFKDIDGDGIKDAEDLPIQDWEMFLNDGQKQLTDVNGMVMWTVTSGGNYKVSEGDLNGWVHTNGNSQIVNVASGDANKIVEFLNKKIIYQINLTKTDSPDPVSPGGFITYTLTWSVAGNTKVTNLTLTDPLPANTLFASVANGGVYNETTKIITWFLGEKNPGDSGTVTFVVKALANLHNGTVITNTATLDSSETEPVSAAANTTITAAPILNIDKTVDLAFANPGNVVTYTVVVSNTGNETAYEVVLTDTLPAGFTFNPEGTATKSWALGDLLPGASKTVNYPVNVGKSVIAGFYDNLAETSAKNHGKVSDKATVEVRVPSILSSEAFPELAISKIVDKNSVNPNNLVNYTVTVKNNGEANAYSVILTDKLPAGFTFTDTGLGEKTWKLGDMAPGSSTTMNYEVLVGKDVKPGDYLNLATVKADNNDPITASVNVKVKQGVVLGLTGPKWYEIFYYLLGLLFVFGGIKSYQMIKRQEILVK